MPDKLKKWLLDKRVWVVLSTALAIVAILTSTDEPTLPSTKYSVLQGTSRPAKVPGFRVHNASGKRVPLPHNDKGLTILHFWATWCTPCLAELPELDKAAPALEQKGVMIVPVAVGNITVNEAKAYYDKLNIQHLQLYTDVRYNIMHKLPVNVLPMTHLLNGSRRSIAMTTGVVDWKSDPLANWLKEKPVTFKKLSPKELRKIQQESRAKKVQQRRSPAAPAAQ